MRYYKVIEDGYIVAIGTGADGEEITKEEYDEIMSIIRNKPTAESGYDYKLKEDLTWELVEVPEVEPTDDEISGDELLNMIEEVM
jgi:hypothetical protein